METVKDIMSDDPVACTPETSLPTVARAMCENDCGEIPVVADKQSLKPVGVITDRDITCRTVGFGRNPLELKAADVMTKSPATISPDSSIDECVKLMEDKKIRRLLVVDDGGRLIGIVAQADLETRAGEVVKELSHH